jgi:signal transduction histidine kinase
VNEREQERLRIRRDLHDELGPILASQGLKLAAARQMIRSAREKAEGLVDEVTQQSQETVTEIRRLVHGLRPPALDQLGLVEAVRDFVHHGDGDEFNAQGLVFEIDAPPDGLPELPPAVEVNAYRIVLEALSNAARHAQAQRCTVKFLAEQESEDAIRPAILVIQINDDGIGFPDQYRAGVGVRSMRARAEEIGGRLTIKPRQPHGTRITAWLPLSL